MKRLMLLVVLAVLASPAVAPATPYGPVRPTVTIQSYAARTHPQPGCGTRTCDHRVMAAWAVQHYSPRPLLQLLPLPIIAPPAAPRLPSVLITPFDRCVAFHESGLPIGEDQDAAAQEINNGGGDVSYFQWLPTTFQGAERGAGLWFSADPTQVGFPEQVIVFHYWESKDPGAWPQTVPECGGGREE